MMSASLLPENSVPLGVFTVYSVILWGLWMQTKPGHADIRTRKRVNANPIII